MAPPLVLLLHAITTKITASYPVVICTMNSKIIWNYNLACHLLVIVYPLRIIVLLRKLLVSQELGVHSLLVNIPSLLPLLDPVGVSLVRVVVRASVLLLQFRRKKQKTGEIQTDEQDLMRLRSAPQHLHHANMLPILSRDIHTHSIASPLQALSHCNLETWKLS